MAIYCNTLEGNMQYGNDPYCFTPNTYPKLSVGTLEHTTAVGSDAIDSWVAVVTDEDSCS